MKKGEREEEKMEKKEKKQMNGGGEEQERKTVQVQVFPGAALPSAGETLHYSTADPEATPTSSGPITAADSVDLTVTDSSGCEGLNRFSQLQCEPGPG